MNIVENSMVVDSFWNEIEYGVPDANRLRRIRRAYEDAEGGCNEQYSNGGYTGGRKNSVQF